MSDAGERACTALAAAVAGGTGALDHYRKDLTVERKDGKTDLVTRADREAEAIALETIEAAYPEDPVVAEETAGTAAVPEAGPAWIVDPIDGTNNFVRGIPLWATAVAAVADGDPIAAAVVCPAVDATYAAGAGSGGPRRCDVATAREGAAAFERRGDSIRVSERADPETMAVAPTVWWDFDRRDEYAAAASEVVHRFGDLARFRSAQVTLAMVATGALDATFTNLTPHPWDSVAGAHLVERAGGTVTDIFGDPWRHDAEGLVASNGACHEEVCEAARAVAAVADEA